MKQYITLLISIVFIVLLIINYCKENNRDRQLEAKNHFGDAEVSSADSVVKNGNITVTISTDISKLGKLLNFTKYKPSRAKFKHTFFDNSGRESFSVPGPSDYTLEVLLYFDAAAFKKLANSAKKNKAESVNFNKDEFKFDWLDDEILTELNDSDKNYSGCSDLFFGTINGKLWCLNNKVLIKIWTN